MSIEDDTRLDSGLDTVVEEDGRVPEETGYRAGTDGERRGESRHEVTGW